MTHEKLLLDRTFGLASAEDHIDWAVARLVEGADGPNLRILAGLNPRFDRDEVETYFKKACAELGLNFLPPDPSPRKAATVVHELFKRHDLSARK